MSVGPRIVRSALKKLRERREELGMSQAALAEAIDVNTSYIGLLERGDRVPSLDVLIALTTALGIEPSALFMEQSAETEMPEVVRIRALLAGWPVKHRKVAVRVIEELAKLVRPG